MTVFSNVAERDCGSMPTCLFEGLTHHVASSYHDHINNAGKVVRFRHHNVMSFKLADLIPASQIPTLRIRLVDSDLRKI